MYLKEDIEKILYSNFSEMLANRKEIVYPKIFKEIKNLNLEFTVDCRRLVKQVLNKNDIETLKIFKSRYNFLKNFDDVASKISFISLCVSALAFLVNVDTDLKETVIGCFIVILCLAMYVVCIQIPRSKILSAANFVEDCVEEIIEERTNGRMKQKVLGILNSIYHNLDYENKLKDNKPESCLSKGLVTEFLQKIFVSS